MGAFFKEKTDAEVVAHEEDAASFSFPVDRTVIDGEEIVPGMKVLLTSFGLLPPSPPPVVAALEHDQEDEGDPRDDAGAQGERPVPSMPEAHAFASDRSQSARLVNPIMTASIQYWERAATWARS